MGIEILKIMKKTYKILEKIIYAIILLIAILLVWSILPVKNGPKIFVVLSGSMEPAMHTGSVVIIKPESQYKIGDIVTFGKNAKTQVPTTHRIISSRAVEGVMLFTTKGDANNGPDITEIRQSDIHGKALLSVPYIGYLVNFIRKPIGLIVVIVIPALFVIYDEIRKIRKEVTLIREKKKKVGTEEIKDENNKK